MGLIEPGNLYRTDFFQPLTSIQISGENPAEQPTKSLTVPISRGDRLEVEIKDVGDQGDELSRIGPGYINFVPGTEVSKQVEVG